MRWYILNDSTTQAPKAGSVRFFDGFSTSLVNHFERGAICAGNNSPQCRLKNSKNHHPPGNSYRAAFAF
ncbi:MAG: hypothetical protein VW736_05305, partial [Alphaproteobacteria bacterium]